MTTIQILTTYDTSGKAKPARKNHMTNFTRYFELRVTGCKNCHECYSTCDETWGLTRYRCGHTDADKKGKMLFNQNRDQLTPTCPRWNETKESEPKYKNIEGVDHDPYYEPVEPHAELKAMYEQQVKDGTLDNYVWEYKFHLSKEFVPLDGSVVVPGQLLTYADHEYRCTPKPPRRAPPPLVWPDLECVHDWVQNLQDAHRTCIYCKKSEPIEALA